MAEIETTTADDIRDAIAAAILSIVPRHPARRGERFVRAKDQEIPGGSQFRLFDVDLGPEREAVGDLQNGAWHGGGIVMRAEAMITVSYSVSTPDAQRFAGADGQDISAVLVRLHLTTPGMFPISSSGPAPVIDGPELEGDSGRHVAKLRTVVHFFVSDEVQVA